MVLFGEVFGLLGDKRMENWVICDYSAMGKWKDVILTDEALGTFMPIVLYWIYSGIYYLLQPLDGYRLHTVNEEKMKNLVSRSTVVKGVLLQQSIQALVAMLLFTENLEGYD